MEKYKDAVNKIINELIKYKNKDKLSWNLAYKDVLKKLKLESYQDDQKLLSYVVSKITREGFDIMDEPFSLVKFK